MKLELMDSDVALISQTLADLPYRAVAGLLDRIAMQVREIKLAPPPEPPAPETPAMETEAASPASKPKRVRKPRAAVGA